jgi:hypothetical protein
MAAHIEEIKVYQVTSTSGSQLVQVQPAGVTASSYSYDKAPSLAVDGVEDPSNYWGTSVHIPRGLVPQWLALDLGSTLAISNITTHFYDGDLRTYTYYIQVSNDSSSWTWQEPWKTAYDAMMSDADTALGSGPFSVTFNGGPNGGHDYHTDPPYTSDGVFDPNADRRSLKIPNMLTRH